MIGRKTVSTQVDSEANPPKPVHPSGWVGELSTIKIRPLNNKQRDPTPTHPTKKGAVPKVKKTAPSHN